MNWFIDCTTIDEVRQKYRELAKAHHPDLGGDTSTMQEINLEYTFFSKKFTRENNPNRSQKYYDNIDAANEALKDIIVELMKLKNITIEICGLWIWVSGNTKPNIAKFKELGMRWASKKKMWFYAGIPAGGFATCSMDVIRSTYGSKVYKSKGKSDEDEATGQRQYLGR